MSFLQPLLLFALPLALLPVIVHLIHQHRRRTVPWAAMMFLRRAQRMNRGFSRLRRWLILAFRMLAILALLLMAARPLAGGLLGLTGGAPQTVIVLLDRSASMEQTHLATGLSKREAGLNRLVEAMREAYRGRSRVILIDSATGEPLEVGTAEQLTDLPSTWATDTTADIPGLLQAALEYIVDNQTGRTDVWLLSDLQATTWEAGGGRWDTLRQAFVELPGVRFNLLCYPEPAVNNLAVAVDRVSRRDGRDQAELVIDLDIVRTDAGAPAAADGDTGPDQVPGAGASAQEVPLRFVINGVTTVVPVDLRDQQASLRGHVIPIDRTVERGWGRVELPADSQPSDNVWHFVFDRPPVMASAIVTEDANAMLPVRAALSAPADSTREYEAAVFTPDRTAEIEWDQTALIVWHAPLPARDELVRRQLENHLAAGRSILFFPPGGLSETGDEFLGVSWGGWNEVASSEAMQVAGWRNDTGLLANTRDGTALPVGEIELLSWRDIAVNGATVTPLARLENQQPLLLRATPDDGEVGAQGNAYFIATLPGTRTSTLARDGVVLYAMLHRALATGGDTLGLAQQRFAATGVLGDDEQAGNWRPLEAAAGDAEATPTELLGLRAGVLSDGERLLALNRPPEEDQPRRLGLSTLEERFEGIDHRIIVDTLEDDTSLASEIWRTFLLLMAAALILEALLSMPARTRPQPAAGTAAEGATTGDGTPTAAS